MNREREPKKRRQKKIPTVKNPGRPLFPFSTVFCFVFFVVNEQKRKHMYTGWNRSPRKQKKQRIGVRYSEQEFEQAGKTKKQDLSIRAINGICSLGQHENQGSAHWGNRHIINRRTRKMLKRNDFFTRILLPRLWKNSRKPRENDPKHIQKIGQTKVTKATVILFFTCISSPFCMETIRM